MAQLIPGESLLGLALRFFWKHFYSADITMLDERLAALASLAHDVAMRGVPMHAWMLGSVRRVGFFIIVVHLQCDVIFLQETKMTEFLQWINDLALKEFTWSNGQISCGRVGKKLMEGATKGYGRFGALYQVLEEVVLQPRVPDSHLW
ncbi:hypothetical protein ACJX0J_031146, partial [Zea mays]